MAVIEEDRIGAYIYSAVNSLYSDVLHIRGLQRHESDGGGVAISSHEDSYGDDKIFVKINGSSIAIAEEYNELERVGLEDPNSIERFWKILNKHVMKMIDKKVVQVINDLQTHQDSVNTLMREQLKLMSAKTHIVNKMVTNPVIVEIEDIGGSPKSDPDDPYDAVPF